MSNNYSISDEQNHENKLEIMIESLEPREFTIYELKAINVIRSERQKFLATNPSSDECMVSERWADKHGYVRFNISVNGISKSFSQHRIAMMEQGYPLPIITDYMDADTITVDHMCKNRCCYRAEHLRVLRLADNSANSSWATRTHCSNGHEYNEENTRYTSDGRVCLICEKDRNTKYYLENQEEALEKAAVYREQNREQIAEKQRDYYDRNREEILDKQKEYYQDNREERIEKQAEYNEAHREEINAKQKAYVDQNREEVNRRQVEYYKQNKALLLEQKRTGESLKAIRERWGIVKPPKAEKKSLKKITPDAEPKVVLSKAEYDKARKAARTPEQIEKDKERQREYQRRKYQAKKNQ